MQQYQIRNVFTALFVLCAAGVAHAQNYDAGIAALQAGEFSMARKELRPLAEAGDGRAQYQTGLMYEYARGYKQSDAKAASWYGRAAAQNIAAAQYRLGVLHENGWGVAQNHSRAAHWYTKAAMQDHGLAQHDLAFLYFAGNGVPRDEVQAYMWLKIAQLQGNALMVKHLRHVARDMSTAQINKAHRLAHQWLRGRKL
ncbi:MAG: tetratricopeptide repeat protein [Pseudomonadota bacterium]